MKTLTILFESPNVFYAVIDGVNIRIDNPELLIEYDGNIIDPCFEAKKCLHDTGVVCKISTVSSCPKVYRDVFAKFNGNRLKPGDIFQVEGFEYEVNVEYLPISRGFSYKKEGSDQIKQCDLVKDGIGYYDNGKVAILKLAKEEEPKEQLHYDENIFIETWYHRNPVHEINTNTGKDMFWRSAFMVMEDYINKLKK